MKLFIPITKVDEKRREVWGTLASEMVDKVGEVFDYKASKPHFSKWSQEFARMTDGKSMGNLRSMHSNIAAGKLISMQFDDGNRKIDIGAKVVDDNEWDKVMEGVYTGFSIGGKYAKRWDDPGMKATRYEAVPSEASLVDNPCIPGAVFSVIKANGKIEDRTHEYDEKKNVRWLKIAEREDVSDADKKRAKEEYGDVKFADEKNKKYPIDTDAHIRAAWNYINKEKNSSKYSSEEVKAIKAKIVSAWKAKIDKEGPPSAEKIQTIDDLKKDHAYRIQSVAGLLAEVQYLLDTMEMNYPEDDAAPISSALNDAKAALAECISLCAEAEIAEVSAGEKMTKSITHMEDIDMTSEELTKLIKENMQSLVKVEDLAKISDSISKIATSITQVQEGLKKVQEDTAKSQSDLKVLGERVEKIEKTPQSGGPKLFTETEKGKEILGKMATEKSTLESLIAKETDPVMKAKLGEKLAVITLREQMLVGSAN